MLFSLEIFKLFRLMLRKHSSPDQSQVTVSGRELVVLGLAFSVVHLQCLRVYMLLASPSLRL